MEKSTAFYNRVSTEHQKDHGTSLQYQEESCFRKASELGIPKEQIKIYTESFSGENIDRPEMDKLREDIKNGMFDRLIIVHPDRLSRDMVDRLIVCAEFEKYGVELIFVDTEYKNSEEGKLFFNIQSSIAQYELSLIKKRTRRGSIKASQNGKIVGLRCAPYGYDYIKGEGKLEINDVEAEFVKKIFQWYVYDKLTLREIGNKLCATGAIPKLKKIPEWSHSSIQKIIKNETYIGKFYYNKKHMKKVKGERTANGKQKREYEYRDKEEWIEITVPAIIDPATFTLAEEQRHNNIKRSGNIKNEYLLRQKIRCGNCGYKYSSNTTTSYSKQKDENGKPKAMYTRTSYRCAGTKHSKFGENVEKCNAKSIRADFLEEYIWNELIMSILNDTDTIIEKVKNQYEKPNQEVEETFNLLKFKMAKLEEEKKRVVQLFKKAYIDEEEMDRDIAKINDGIKSLKIEMSKYEQQMFNIGKNELNVKILKETIDELKKKIDNEDEVPFEVKRQILDYLIDEIVVKWENDNLKVTCIGVIDSIMRNNSAGNDELVVDTTPKRGSHDTRVFNLLHEVLFSVDKVKSTNRLEVIESHFNIG